MNQLFHQQNFPHLLEPFRQRGYMGRFPHCCYCCSGFCDSVLITECHMPKKGGGNIEPKIRHTCYLSQKSSAFYDDFFLSCCMLICAIDFFCAWGILWPQLTSCLRPQVYSEYEADDATMTAEYSLREAANKQIPFVFRLVGKMRVCSRKHQVLLQALGKVVLR